MKKDVPKLQPNIYMWTEDRKGKSGYTFWKVFMEQLFPDVIVESKKNNSELVKAVRDLTDDKNKYLIVLDNSFDNLQVYQEQKRLRKYTDSKNNIFIINIICFEYILLEFNKLIDWIYAEGDEFKVKRAKVIDAREQLIEMLQSGNIDYKSAREIVEYDSKLDKYNIERLSAKMLFDLTRNTGFEVSKPKIGDCWMKSCCEWQGRQNSDICGLDGRHLPIRSKMKEIYYGSSLCAEFSNIGMEV